MNKIFALLIATSILFSACSTVPASVSSEQSTKSASKLESYPSVSSSEPIESAPSSNSSSVPDSSKPVGIKGSHITDIMLGLEQTGAKIPKPEMKSSKDKAMSAYYCDAAKQDDITGITFDYSLSADTDFALISGVFGITDTAAIGEDIFTQVAKGYLGFCSTMPCDAVSDDLARVWLEDVVDHIAERESGTNIIFDDAKYQLHWSNLDDGSIVAIWLTISRVDPDVSESQDSAFGSPKMYEYKNPPSKKN